MDKQQLPAEKRLQMLTGLSEVETKALLVANDGNANLAANAFLNSQVAARGADNRTIHDTLQDLADKHPDKQEKKSARSVSIGTGGATRAKQLQALTGLPEAEANKLLAANNDDVNRAADHFFKKQVDNALPDSRMGAGSTFSGREILQSAVSSVPSDIATMSDAAAASTQSQSEHKAMPASFPPLETRDLKASLNCRIPIDLAQLDLLHARCVTQKRKLAALS